MRILVIDGNANDRQNTAQTLLADRMKLELAEEGSEGIDLAKLYDFDLITMDLQLPDMSGFDVIRRIRAAGIKTPILILSTMSLVSDIVKALGLGADDYMTKPFDPLELVARITALVRRSKGLAQSLITTGNIELNLNTRTVKVGGADVRLTGKEYQMLELLSLRKGMTQSKDAFLTALYGGMDEPEIKIVDVFICKLRKKLAHAVPVIETVWGCGYVLRDPAAGSPAMVVEVADFADDPPTGFVSRITHDDRQKKAAREGKFTPGKPVHIVIPAIPPTNPEAAVKLSQRRRDFVAR